MEWRVASWSRESARGVVRASNGATLAFDAGVVTVGDLHVGEAVHVDVVADRVVSVAPLGRPAAPVVLVDDRVRVVPTGLLALRVAAHDLARIEDRAFDELELATIVDFSTGYVTDTSPALRALLEHELGHAVGALVRVEGTYPFDWEGRGALEPMLDRLAATLPGFDPRWPTAFFADDARAARGGLWWSVEPPGLQIGGELAEASFVAWRSAFERATAAWPRRRA